MSVYTTVSADELRAFLAEFDAGELVAFEGISAGIENTNYFVDTSRGRYVLTLFEQHGFDQLGYFLSLMAWMSEAGVPTAHPLASRDGQYLHRLCGKPAALVQRLKGRSLEVADSIHCAVLGGALARFHLAGRGFNQRRVNDRGLDWMASVRARLVARMDADTLSLVDEEMLAQQVLMVDELPSGVMHADLFLDNALFDGEELTGIIDLYYACHGPWLYDVAVAMNDWCRLPDLTLDAGRVRSLLGAYAAERPWTDAERSVWPLLARRAALRFFLSRLQDQLLPREGELTQTKDPAVFRQLLLWLREHCPPLAG